MHVYIWDVSLQVQEAMLTGESVPISKNLIAVDAKAGLGDRKCMAFSATTVSAGQGLGVVVATGACFEFAYHLWWYCAWHQAACTDACLVGNINPTTTSCLGNQSTKAIKQHQPSMKLTMPKPWPEPAWQMNCCIACIVALCSCMNPVV
jgi:hypothetical protein